MTNLVASLTYLVNAELAMIEAAQIRAARALLNISQAELAGSASVSAATVKRLEASSEIRGTAESLWKVEKALETLGVEFIPAEGERGPGVRLRGSQQVG
jgi:transcriptional regulator with XRE-family HTH domain